MTFTYRELGIIREMAVEAEKTAAKYGSTFERLCGKIGNLLAEDLRPKPRPDAQHPQDQRFK